MLLKRLYDKTNPENPKVSGIRILRSKSRQHFSPDLVEKAEAEGWMSMKDGRITLHDENKPVVYRVVRTPGYYCCHCGAPMAEGSAARAHIDKEHAKKKSPDVQNPSGYERINYFDCVKE